AVLRPYRIPPGQLQALAECALARAKCPLGRNANVIDAGLPWRLPLESAGCPKEVGPKSDEQITVVALGVQPMARAAGLDPDALTLKRASTSRPSGEWRGALTRGW